MAPKTTRCCASCGKTQSLHCLPSDPNNREWMNFIFKKFQITSRTLSFIHLILLQIFYKQGTIRSRIFFRKIEIKDDAVPATLDPTVMTQHTSVSNCFHYVVTIALSVITDRLI